MERDRHDISLEYPKWIFEQFNGELKPFECLLQLDRSIKSSYVPIQSQICRLQCLQTDVKLL